MSCPVNSHETDYIIEHFTDRLLARCQEMGSPICVGIDPVYDRLPVSLRLGGDANTRESVAAISEFVEGVLQAVAPYAACVKFQSACFERYLWLGVQAYHRLVDHARRLGLLVIGDAKRGDIGISAAHYAAGCLGDHPDSDLGNLVGPDAITVNPYLGADSLSPFIDVAVEQGKGVFSLVRTSNPGGDALQGRILNNGQTVAQAVAKFIAQLGAEKRCIGRSGYSLLGAVVGATKGSEMVQLRALMPNQVFLVPGFGAQGGSAQDIKPCFKSDGTGAIITASRSILFAYEKTHTQDWRGAIEEACVEMKQQVASVLD